MNRLAIACLFTVAAAAAQAGAPVAADTAPTLDTATVVETDATAGKPENIVIRPDVAKTRYVADTGCVRTSGSRVRRPVDENGCNGLPGSSYTRSQLDSTGAATTAEALKRLDSRL
jgi:hypothetical protein